MSKKPKAKKAKKTTVTVAPKLKVRKAVVALAPEKAVVVQVPKGLKAAIIKKGDVIVIAPHPIVKRLDEWWKG